jgi:hypothetical protein
LGQSEIPPSGVSPGTGGIAIGYLYFICFQKSDAKPWHLSLKRKSGLHFLFEKMKL